MFWVLFQGSLAGLRLVLLLLFIGLLFGYDIYAVNSVVHSSGGKFGFGGFF